MNVGMEAAQAEKLAARAAARALVRVMAIFATVLGALYLLGLAGKLIVDGSVHSTSSPAVQSTSAVVALLWNVGLLVLFVALRRQAARSERLLSELAAVFMALVCATSSINWFIQLAILPRLRGAGDATMLALLDVHSELSLSYAVEHLGWGLFFGLAALCAGLAMRGDRLELWIRWLLLASGTLSLLHFIGVIAGSTLLGDLGYVAWGVLLPAATALLAVRFKKQPEPVAG